MSFSFEWPRFSEQFHADAIEMLNSALNKGSKPPVIADKIEVVELEMGTQVRFVRLLTFFFVLLFGRISSLFANILSLPSCPVCISGF